MVVKAGALKLREYDSGWGNIAAVIGFIFGLIIISFSPNIWISLLLSLSLSIASFSIIDHPTASAIMGGAFILVFLYLLITLYASYSDSKKYTDASWREISNDSYQKTRLQSMDKLQNIQRLIGISNEKFVDIVTGCSFKDGDFRMWDDKTYHKRDTSFLNGSGQKPAKKKYLPPNWKYRILWYQTGYAPIDTEMDIPPNSFILMTAIPDDYTFFISEHKFFLVEPPESTDYTDAILKTKSTLKDDDKIFAISLGQYEIALR